MALPYTIVVCCDVRCFVVVVIGLWSFVVVAVAELVAAVVNAAVVVELPDMGII